MRAPVGGFFGGGSGTSQTYEKGYLVWICAGGEGGGEFGNGFV